MKHIKYILFFLLFFISCEDDNEKNILPTSSIQLNFTHLVNNQPIEFNTKRYTNEAGNEYNIQEFKYYVSNVKLRNTATGELFIVPESYHLVTPTQDNQEINLNIEDIPLGNFNEIEFAIGVDNSKNYSIDNIGDLDPSSNMVWNWDTGYKFLLLEGNFYPADGSDTRGLVYHIGSDQNYRILRYPFTNSLPLEAGKTTEINFQTEVSEIFKNPTTMDFNEFNVVKFQEITSKIADNYSNMITLQGVVSSQN